jgi:triacylglycerol lipase
MLTMMLPSRPRRAASHLARALVAALLVAMTAAPANAASPEPVLLVHGFQGSPSNFSDLKLWLEGQGRTVVALTLPSQDNKVNAQYIKTQLGNLGWTRADLVMHSMGGLSGRYFIKSLAGATAIQAYVSLGTPQYGIWAACFLPQNNGGQMCPWSSFLTGLNSGDDTPNGPAWATIYSTSDELVPASRAKLDGGACHFQVSGITHDGLLHSPAVTFPLVLAALDDVADATCPAGGVYKL